MRLYIQRFATESFTLEKSTRELKDFANKWNKPKNYLQEDLDRIFGDGNDTSSSDNDMSDCGDNSMAEVENCTRCKECPAC